MDIPIRSGAAVEPTVSVDTSLDEAQTVYDEREAGPDTGLVRPAPDIERSEEEQTETPETEEEEATDGEPDD